MIRFSCPGCGAVYSVTDDKAGKTGKCPKCQTPFTIPAAEAAAPPPPPPKPQPSGNPFADLSGDDAPRKKKPSKADLDDDLDDRPKKKPARAADDDEDDRPRKKPRRDDDEDDLPPKKKPSKADLDDDLDDRPKKKARRDEDDEDAPPRKKGRRDEEDDDFDDRPRKKPARAADDDYDDEDDRPRKKGRRADDEFDDDYDDRPRKKKGKSGLLLTAAILHIIAAVIYLPCGGLFLAGASVVGAGVDASDEVSRPGRNQMRVDPTAKAGLDEFERRASNAKTGILLFQISTVLSVIAACVAIAASVAAFTRKKWFVLTTLINGGALVLSGLVSAVALFGFWAFQPMLLIVVFVLLALAFGIFFILAAVNKNVKRVLS